MAILLNCNAIFLHIPKTGGFWIRKALYDNELVVCEFSHEHADLERILHISGHYPGDFLRKSLRYGMNFEKKINSAYKFAFIRHPVSWYISTWSYMESLKWRDFVKHENPSRYFMKYDPWHPFEKFYKYKSSDINEFINNILNEMPGFYTHLIYSYTGINALNFIGRQENLVEDMKEVLTRLGIDVEKLYLNPEKVNKTNVSPPQLTQELIDRISETEYPIIYKYYS